MMESPTRYIPLDDLPYSKSDSFDAAHIEETKEVLQSQLEVALSRIQSKILLCSRIDLVKHIEDETKLWQKDEKKAAKNLLDALLRRKQTKQSNTAIRIGLFGGLGQGKTSALIQATSSLSIFQKTHFGKTKNREVRTYSFDIAHYKPDEMEYEFDRIFRSWGMLTYSFFIFVFIGFILVCLSAYFFLGDIANGDKEETFSIFKVSTLLFRIVIPAIALTLGYAGFKFISFWFRDIERSDTFSNKKKVFTRLFFKPDIFIVDNLDRANIEQQIAIFRALYKYSQNLPIAFVICMDETSLLQTDKSPEHPAKLLRKVINVEIRLPARLPQDAPLLCQAILASSLKNNPNVLILSSPSFAGDFSALVSLLDDFSPRIAKRMLNDALTDAQKNQLLHSAEDCGALLRLHMLYAEFSGLQQFSTFLIQILECKEASQQSLKIAKLAELSKNDKTRLQQLITLSHYVQPLAGNWKRLIGVHSRPKNPIEQPRLKTSLIKNQEAAQNLWEGLNTIKQGYGEQEISTLRGKKGVEKFAIHIWPMLSVMLAHEQQAESRLRLLRWYSKTVDQLENGEQQGLLRYATLRYWLGDYQVITLLSQQEQDDLVATIQNLDNHRRIYLLPIINPENVSFDAVFALLVEEPSGDHRIIREWLNQVALNDTDGSYTGSSNSSAFLAAIWPTLPADCLELGWVTQLEKQFKLFKTLNDLSLLTHAPNSLVSALFTEGNWQRLVFNDKANQLLHSLILLLHFDKKWSLNTWQVLTSGLLERDKQHRVSELIEHASCHIPEVWAAALLLTCDVDDKESIEHLLKTVGALNSPELVKLFIAKPDYLLWKSATGEQIKTLLSNLIPPYNEEWSRVRIMSNRQLLNCFNKHNDEHMLIDIFELEVLWE